MKTFLAATLALCAGTTLSVSAVAADMPPPAVFDWSGAYVGLQGGYDWGETRNTNTNGSSTGDFDIDGFLGGATAGWNHQMDNIVIGLEADISAAGISGRDAPTTTCLGLCTSDIDWLGTLRGRAGFAQDQWLIYATAGLAVGGVDAKINFGPGYGTSDTNVGWTAGGGVEWAFSETLSAKAEYLFVDLGDVTFPYAAGSNTVEFDSNHIMRVGLNWHF